MVILDALSKAGVLDKVAVFFVDTYHLFPESISFLKEVRSQHATCVSLVRLLKIMSLTFHVQTENHYGFKAKVYAAADCPTQEDFFKK